MKAFRALALVVTIVGAVVAGMSLRAASTAESESKEEITVPTAPCLLPFQGRLLTAKGGPVPEGKAEAIFSIYVSDSAPEAIWWEKLALDVGKDGFVHTILGQEKPLDASEFGRVLFLGIRVHNPNSGDITENAPEMLPRIQILPALYACQADHAKRADDAKTVKGRDLAKEFDDLVFRLFDEEGLGGKK